MALFSGFTLLAQFVAFAQTTWDSVDTWDGTDGAYGYGIGTDANGNLFSVGGDINADGTYHQAVIRKSTDNGATWSPKYSGFIAEGATAATLWTFAADHNASSGNPLYVGGSATVGAASRWVVCRSIDGGENWEVSDVFQYQPGFQAICKSLAVDASGNVYAVGYSDAKSQMLWTARKSSDGGVTWKTLETLGGKTGMNFAREVACGRDADGRVVVFVVGYLTVSGGNVWTVRRSLDGGNSWTAVDSYRLGKTYSSATGITVSADAIYVVGFSGNTWIVRRSSDGLKWATIDDSYPYGTPWGVTIANGNVYVAGYAGRWLVRKATPPAGATSWQWQVSDDFQFSPGQTASAEAITTDSSGNIFATGYAHDASGIPHWFTRKLPWP